MQSTVCTWRSEDNLRCLSSPSTLFETGSFVHCCTCLATWLSRFQGFSYLESSGMTDVCHVQIYMGLGDLNLGPHACIVSTFPTYTITPVLLQVFYTVRVLYSSLCSVIFIFHKISSAFLEEPSLSRGHVFSTVIPKGRSGSWLDLFSSSYRHPLEQPMLSSSTIFHIYSVASHSFLLLSSIFRTGSTGYSGVGCSLNKGIGLLDKSISYSDELWGKVDCV